MKSVKLFLILGVFIYGESSIVVEEAKVLNSMENDKNISMSYEFNSLLFEKLNENNTSLVERLYNNQNTSMNYEFPMIGKKPSPISCPFLFCTDTFKKELILLENSASFDKEGEGLK